MSPCAQHTTTNFHQLFTHPPMLLHCQHTIPSPDDLEEALLFEFEGEESSLTPKNTITPSLISATASCSSLLGGTGSLPSMISGVRSITKDSAGTHVLTENFTLHIEEVRSWTRQHMRLHLPQDSWQTGLLEVVNFSENFTPHTQDALAGIG
jgi:hypothetical protein